MFTKINLFLWTMNRAILIGRIFGITFIFCWFDFSNAQERKNRAPSIKQPSDATVVANSKWEGCLHFSYPSHFESRFGHPEGGGWMNHVFESDSSRMNFSINGHGWVSKFDLLKTIPGVNDENYNKRYRDERSFTEQIEAEAKFKTCGDFFKAKQLKNGADYKKLTNYERFIVKDETSVTAYFLMPLAYKIKDGRCYRILRFNFEEGRYEKYKASIYKILDSVDAKSDKPLIPNQELMKVLPKNPPVNEPEK